MSVNTKIPDLLKLVDELIFYYTGKHLDSLQKTILIGALQNKSYLQIAQETGYSDSHFKNIGADLFNLLSEITGEKITKKNVKYIFNKNRDYNFISDYMADNLTVNNHNYCGNNNQEKAKDIFKQHRQKAKSNYLDLDEAPTIFNFSNRQSELTILKQFILEDEIKLINIYGLFGMGKSALIRKLVEEIKTEFDYVIWRNLSQELNLLELKKDLQQIFSVTNNQEIVKIFNSFRAYRCLIILDDLQLLFQPNALAGEFSPQYKNYYQFLQKIVTTNHQSCFILISRDKLRSFSVFESQQNPVKSFQLKGLGESAKSILTKHQLQDEESWSKLIELYQGNPLWLNLISLTIKDLFNGSVNQFLNSQNSLFLGDIELILSEYLSILSTSERELIKYCVDNHHFCFSLEDIVNKNNSILPILQSLQRRCLLEKINDKSNKLFQLNSILTTISNEL